MSSYLYIGAIPVAPDTENESKIHILCSYTRSTEIYRYCTQELDIPYIGNDDGWDGMKKFSSEDLEKVVNVMKEDLAKIKKSKQDLERIVFNNSNLTPINSTQSTYDTIKSFIRDIDEYTEEIEILESAMYELNGLASMDVGKGYHDYDFDGWYLGVD